MTQYVLRSYYFGYNDENFYVCGWRIEEIYDDREKAEAAYRKLQLKYLRQLDLGEHGYIFNGDSKYLKKLDDYLYSKTGKHILADGGYVDKYTEVHTKLNDDDLFEFGEFGNLRAYKLIAFEDEALFYAMWNPRAGEYFKFFDEYCEGPVYGTSQDDVIQSIEQNECTVDWDDWEARGTLEELSDNPVLLRKLIDKGGDIRYNEAKARLYLSYPEARNVVALNALLKSPLFEIRELDAATIVKLETGLMDDEY